MSICSHFKKISTEKLGNLISKADFKKCQNPRHTVSTDIPASSELWFCLTCGYVGCGRSAAEACSLKHFESNQAHSLSISPTTLMIWCYQCDNSIDEMLELSQNKNKGEAEKLSNFKEKITQLFFKINKELLKKSKNTVVLAPELNSEPEKMMDFAKGNEGNAPKTIFGLKNIGNTCFFNSVMQCLNATQPLTGVYLDLKNFDVSDLRDDEETDAPGPSNDDWITVAKPKPKKNEKGKGKGAKGKNNTMHSQKSSSFINISKIFQDFLVEARAKKGKNHDPHALFSSISHL